MRSLHFTLLNYIIINAISFFTENIIVYRITRLPKLRIDYYEQLLLWGQSVKNSTKEI